MLDSSLHFLHPLAMKDHQQLLLEQELPAVSAADMGHCCGQGGQMPGTSHQPGDTP